jgi:hypothetical protein
MHPALVVTSLAVALSACGGSSYLAGVRVSVANDTAQAVLVYVCANEACTDFRDSHTLAPGERIETVTDDQGTPNPVKIVDGAGRVMGCLPLIFEERPETEPVQVFISRAMPCQADYT